MSVPQAWLSPVAMHRIVLHWTAGSHAASAEDKEHYHIILEGDGTAVRGDHEISDNVDCTDDDYAAHTRGLNTRTIGVSMACMAGAKESPFDAGRYPMTEEQWDAAIVAVAQLCKYYGIPVRRDTVLTHAEVQGTLGVKQAGKWDVTRIPFFPDIVGAKACGDLFRRKVQELL